MAKPENWESMNDDERREVARTLLQSIRGRYILSQALHYAIRDLKRVEPDYMQEKSNIEDMEILQEVYFSIFFPHL